MKNDLDDLLQRVITRYEALSGECEKESFISHLESLASFNAGPMDYEETPAPSFPSKLSIAYAICHPYCGASGFIVDGGTQECEYCGGQMFRTETRQYALLTATESNHAT